MSEEKPSLDQRNLNRLVGLIDMMRARGVTRLAMPWWLETEQGEYHHQLELELKAEPSRAGSPPPAAPREPPAPPKRRDDGLTDAEAAVAYGHVKGR